MNEGTGLAEALLGLDGFRVLAVTETPDEVVIDVETAVDVVGCSVCGTRAVAHERMPVAMRDLACFGRPARLVWNKRRWRCVEPDCEARTWTETSEHFSTRAVLTRRAGAEACRQVGENARPVAELAEELGVCWWTIMSSVIEHGTPLVDDPDRVGQVTQLGIDETTWQKATPSHATLYATGLVDLDERILVDMVEGNTADDLRRWCVGRDPEWLAGVRVVTTDLAESYRAASIPTWLMPPGWRTRSMWSESATGAWTRSAAGCNRRPSTTGGARPTPLPDPQAVAHRIRTPQPTGQRPHAVGAAHR